MQSLKSYTNIPIIHLYDPEILQIRCMVFMFFKFKSRFRTHLYTIGNVGKIAAKNIFTFFESRCTFIFFPGGQQFSWEIVF